MDVVPPPPQLEELLLVLAAAVKVHIAGAEPLFFSCALLATSGSSPTVLSSICLLLAGIVVPLDLTHT